MGKRFDQEAFAGGESKPSFGWTGAGRPRDSPPEAGATVDAAISEVAMAMWGPRIFYCSRFTNAVVSALIAVFSVGW